ncbi:MAG: hypothetical protein Q9162_004997 [Coniocarpon cinnabarinum]
MKLAAAASSVSGNGYHLLRRVDLGAAGRPPQQPQPYNLGMMSGARSPGALKNSPAPVNTARFSTEKPLAPMEKPKPYRNPQNDDHLPAMPTWADSSEQHVEDKTYHPPAETPPGESEIARATGQEGVLLQDRTPQRRPTLPNMEGNAAPALERRPTLPTLDSTLASASSTAYGSSTAPPPAQSGVTSPVNGGYGGAGGGAAAIVGAYGQSGRAHASRKPDAYGYAGPPRRPSDRHQQYPQSPPYQDRAHTVSPISPMGPGPHAGNGYPAQAPMPYPARNNSSAAPQAVYTSRQDQSGWPVQGQTSPHQPVYGAPMPTRTPPPQGHRSPPSRTPPPNQWNRNYPVLQRAPSAPRPAPPPSQPSYQPYNPYGGRNANQSSTTVGRAELGGADVGRSELHGAETNAPRYELGGGEGTGEGGNWQRRPPGGWT